jgi:GTPase-associated protein 1, N-terminal domain type 2
MVLEAAEEWRLQVRAEQAIFTSLPRRGRGGYHLVSRSRRVGSADAQALAQWAPSHGSLIVDSINRTSVNFHRLPSGRFALSRTCAGPPEYSGRGGAQLYTHFLILDEEILHAVRFQPFLIYRDAAALGYFAYQSHPAETLEPVNLSQLYPASNAAYWANQAVKLRLPPLAPIQKQLQSSGPLRFAYAGDRIALAECLIGQLPPDVVRSTSFSTSLVPSSDRPFVLTLIQERRK